MIKNGLTRKEAEDRVASQLPERDKVALADYVIRNNGTRSALRRDTLEFLKVLNGGRKAK
jgi:dephospho-CoA kinase